MPPAPIDLKDGNVYRLVSPYNKYVIELHELKKVPVINNPTGSQWQQWKAIKVYSLWKFESVAVPGLYLGLDRSETVKNGVTVSITPNQDFLWDVTSDVHPACPNALRLRIPHMKHVLEFELNGTLASHKLQLIECYKGVHQCWIIDEDIEPAIPCINGSVYHIQNVRTETVVHFEPHTGNVRGYHYNEGRNQLACQWEAIRAGSDESLWSFKNILNGQYLGISGDVAEPGKLIIGSKIPFKWRLVPNALNSNHFELYVPHVDLSMDIKDLSNAPGTEINLSKPCRDRHWRFEKVDIPNRNLPLWAQEYPGAG
ncbi:hypothetical protein FA15DRAFT_669805 [Coprinopsis marcescibilis]|uniref:Ricin B lectin domain-containing protein n=1 Tax=Coprinopsis marcescibilis TaxID=230819 RepID=A0A5C3L7D4_COPMA|nr:hypothetical protein FA15DRAFT_669805 [Coprinopsis marcescibilis]